MLASEIILLQLLAFYEANLKWKPDEEDASAE